MLHVVCFCHLQSLGNNLICRVIPHFLIWLPVRVALGGNETLAVAFLSKFKGVSVTSHLQSLDDSEVTRKAPSSVGSSITRKYWEVTSVWDVYSQGNSAGKQAPDGGLEASQLCWRLLVHHSKKILIRQLNFIPHQSQLCSFFHNKIKCTEVK